VADSMYPTNIGAKCSARSFAYQETLVIDDLNSDGIDSDSLAPPIDPSHSPPAHWRSRETWRPGRHHDVRIQRLISRVE